VWHTTLAHARQGVDVLITEEGTGGDKRGSERDPLAY